MYLHLKAELEREGRAHWLNEEMAILTARETYDPHPEDAWKRLKVRLRKPSELAVVQAIAAWREREARDRNVPRRRVIKDEVIYEIAQQQPSDEAALGGCARSPRVGSARPPPALLAAVNAALAMPKEEMPRLPKPPQTPEGSGAAAELLKVLLRLVAEKEGVAAKVLASSDDIDRIAADGEEAKVAALSGLAARSVRRARAQAGARRDRAQV